MRISPYITALSLAALFSIFTACSDDKSTGTFRVLLIDAPGVYDSVIVSINEVRINKSGIDVATSGWITLSDSVRTLNLLSLTNGNSRFLGEMELDPGTYQQMRLVLGANNYIVLDGTKHNLTIPSGSNTGIKLNLNATIEADQTYNLIVDFDAARSIRRQGNGSYRLQPVLRGVRLEESGSISGTITPAATLPYVYAIQGADTLAGTRSTEAGQFKVMGLAAGSYTVAVIPSLTGYTTQNLTTPAAVTKGNDTSVGTVTISATAAKVQ